MNKVVLDANIFVKLFKKDEYDSSKAIELIEKLVQSEVEILEPSIVVNETITTCEVAKHDIQEVCEFFKALIGFRMTLVNIDSQLLDKTLSITKAGHSKSGYPTFSDSMYNALAIQENALFITADRRHYEKTKHLGNIQLLRNIH